jgi:hypothetical protein
VERQNVASHEKVDPVDQTALAQAINSLAAEVLCFLPESSDGLDLVVEAAHPYLTEIDVDEDEARFSAERERRESELLALVVPQLRDTIVSLFTKAATTCATREVASGPVGETRESVICQQDGSGGTKGSMYEISNSIQGR